MSFAEGLVVRALRGAAAFAAFFAFGRLAPELFEASGSLVVEGKPPIAVSAWDQDAARAGAARDAALARTNERAVSVFGAKPGAAGPGVSDGAPGAGAPLDRFAEFVALHPELGDALARPAPPPPKDPTTDRIRLERERERVQADIAAIARGAAPSSSDDSDNPFGEAAPAPPSDRRLKLRLAEIDASLAALSRAPAPAAPRSLRGELASLLAAVPSSQPVEASTPARRPSISELKGAVVPREPDRRSLLAVGLLAALAAALLPTTRRARRSDELDDIVPGASRGLVLSPPPKFAADELGPEAPPARSVSPAGVQSVAFAPAPLPTPPAPAPAPAYDEPIVASARPRSSPPTGESPVMAYPVPWSADTVPGRDRFPDLRKAFLGEAARDCFVVAISSTPAASDSRADVTAGLAAAFAGDPTARVLVVDADLAAPTLGRALGLEVMSVTDFGKQLGARVEGSADGRWYVLKCSPALHVLGAKAEAPELLLSTHFEDCVADLRPFYDVIILRAPAVSDPVACRAVADVVDGIVLLVSASEKQGGESASLGLSLFGQKRLALELRL